MSEWRAGLDSAPVAVQKHITIYETLKRIGDAEQRRLDTWSISLTSGEWDLSCASCIVQLQNLTCEVVSPDCKAASTNTGALPSMLCTR